jgi:hypothetical protein
MQSTKRLGPESYDVAKFDIPPVARPGIYKFS